VDKNLTKFFYNLPEEIQNKIIEEGTKNLLERYKDDTLVQEYIEQLESKVEERKCQHGKKNRAW